MQRTRKWAPKGRFIPVIDGFIYEVEPQGAAYFVTPPERAAMVRRILMLIPLVIFGAMGVLALVALMLAKGFSAFESNFPAMVVLALAAMALVFAGLRWASLAPARALSGRAPLARDEIRSLRERFEATLPDEAAAQIEA